MAFFPPSPPGDDDVDGDVLAMVMTDRWDEALDVIEAHLRAGSSRAHTLVGILFTAWHVHENDGPDPRTPWASTEARIATLYRRALSGRWGKQVGRTAFTTATRRWVLVRRSWLEWCGVIDADLIEGLLADHRISVDDAVWLVDHLGLDDGARDRARSLVSHWDARIEQTATMLSFVLADRLLSDAERATGQFRVEELLMDDGAFAPTRLPVHLTDGHLRDLALRAVMEMHSTTVQSSAYPHSSGPFSDPGLVEPLGRLVAEPLGDWLSGEARAHWVVTGDRIEVDAWLAGENMAQAGAELLREDLGGEVTERVLRLVGGIAPLVDQLATLAQDEDELWGVLRWRTEMFSVLDALLLDHPLAREIAERLLADRGTLSVAEAAVLTNASLIDASLSDSSPTEVFPTGEA